MPTSTRCHYFENIKPEELLLFIRNFQMTINAPIAIPAAGNIKCLCTLLCGKALCVFETISGRIIHTTNANSNQIILKLGMYLSMLILFKINFVTCHRISKSWTFKVKHYALHLTKLNEYLAILRVWMQIKKLDTRKQIKYDHTACTMIWVKNI